MKTIEIDGVFHNLHSDQQDMYYLIKSFMEYRVDNDTFDSEGIEVTLEDMITVFRVARKETGYFTEFN